MAVHRRLRILLVDDEPDILLLLQAMLSATAWEVVGKATSGESALRISTDITPDVAVIDYMMPGMHGMELAERLKGIHPECEVLIFSAFDVREEALGSPHVDHFLHKTQVARLETVLSEIAERRGFGG